MPRPTSAEPTKVEMQILRILGELGPSPVREIHKRLEAAKGTNYSTTVKMLAVMLQKGLVKRDENAQPHVYRPALTRAKTGKRMLDNLIEKVYCLILASIAIFAAVAWAATAVARSRSRSRQQRRLMRGTMQNDKLPSADANDGAWKPGQILDLRMINARTKEPLPGIKLELQYHRPGNQNSRR